MLEKIKALNTIQKCCLVAAIFFTAAQPLFIFEHTTGDEDTQIWLATIFGCLVATEAAKSNTSRHSQTESATAGLQLSHIDQYDLRVGRYVVIGPDGKRDHRAELRLLPHNAQHRKPGYGEYALERFSREFDYRLKRSIDRKVNEWIKKIFD